MVTNGRPVGKCYHTFTGHTDEIVQCVPFGTNLATASFDTQVKLWDMEKCTLVCTLSGHKFRISSIVAFENKLITSSWDKTVKVIICSNGPWVLMGFSGLGVSF